MYKCTRLKAIRQPHTLENRYLEVERSEIMRAKREGKLAAMMQVMLYHMPGDPLTREFVWPAPSLASKDIIQIFRRPALQALLPGAKCYFQAAPVRQRTARRLHTPIGRWLRRLDHLLPSWYTTNQRVCVRYAGLAGQLSGDILSSSCSAVRGSMARTRCSW